MPGNVGSKLAKRLVSPDLVCPDHYNGPDWVLTEGPLVAEVNAAAGFAPDPQQELGLDMIFAVGENGLPASFSFCVICCRQNLKTGLLKQAAIGWLFVTEERLIVWSAHELDTTRDAANELGNMITETPTLSRFLPATPNRGIYDANGQERIELKTGQILKFKARTLSGGRGLSADKVILDEAFALKAAHVGALLPTMTARPHGQVLYASSAGKSDSMVLRDVRDRGRAGSSPRLSYLEWLAEREDCKADDCTHPKNGDQACALNREHLWVKANPTLSTGRIILQTIADLRQDLPAEEFMRESLGWWDEPDAAAAAVFGPGRWEACSIAAFDEPPEQPDPLAVGVAVSVDRTWVSIASAGMVEVLADPDDPESEPVDRLLVGAVERREDWAATVGYDQDGQPMSWLVDRLTALQEKYPDLVFVLDVKGPTGPLIKDFQDADISLETVGLDQYAEACSTFLDRIRATQLLHMGSEELNDAVAGAQWRPVGDRQVWGRRKSASDVSMLEAATLAVYGAEKFGAGFNIY